jgi:integrase
MSKKTLGYDPIERWRQNSKSPISFKWRLAILQRFCRFHKTSPVRLILLANEEKGPKFKIEGMVADFLASLEDAKNQNSTIAKDAGAISGFFRANSVIIKKPSKYVSRSTLESNRVLEQEEVRRMIEVTRDLERRAVICFEAQTAQRIGILTGLTWDMIHRYPVKGSYDYGVVEVKRAISDRNGRCVGNKGRNHYYFGLHWETMKILDELKAQRKGNDPYVFSLGLRGMQRAVMRAAKAAGIQVEFAKREVNVEKRVNGKTIKVTRTMRSHEIHAHAFRRYWVERMDTGRKRWAGQKLLDYQLGHKLPDQTYWEGMLTPAKIVAAFVKADKHLRVLPQA